MKPANVDQFLLNGCGRCRLGGTPDCKVHRWEEELKYLRALVLECGLAEEVKWGAPCYTINKKNVVMLAAFNDCCAISFMKGSLLKDTERILEKPGENTQAGRVVRFTSLEQIVHLADTLKDYIREAMKLEAAGAKAKWTASAELEFPDELLEAFEQQRELEHAFKALTPGRQRGYVIFFTGAKQSKTRKSRIEKCTPDILAGKGMHD